MTSLVIAELSGGALLPATLNTVSAAAAIGSEVHLLLVGAEVEEAAVAASRLQPVSQVFVACGPQFAEPLAENMQRQVLDFLARREGQYQAVLFPATSFGKNCAPRVAAKLDVFQVSDITGVVDASTFERPIYAGNAIATVRSDDAIKVITVRPTAFPPADSGEACRIEHCEAVEGTAAAAFVSRQVTQSDRPDLQSAGIVVSGGRALGSAQAFDEIVNRLADKLGAAVGASRAAVDAGYAPNDYQVGQTGKIVAPKLYIALGISGAIQHLAGMKESGVVVAINKDPDAPIFSVADYGLVADVFDAVPELIRKL
ncbi:electron transfer flavoprotein subunit alpha/FixB family protein [Pluralibacter gergoviae]|uniref:electron transfer flavoprotein subunit alpha/FixB family protein n=1 Tax=Pluralibacter gergoviae TaxID=61647 RepID=UPI00065258AA|nr:FAD-binding protein [Pluralibacter gergoviae]EKT9638749.1 FAD-binding protein [Pluralibacter gergoviae]EKV0931079.1 FAD-binding protein [Pluralibacter gergoviae]EKV6247823.1 FAD-binding protein [Pluralibacter gergoviae]EKW9966543.1 FAD-binding protein [Pluralibacter gergoviae]ELD4270163.1 FAD-binding protein [Pluralibacter gergoviae]